MSKFKNTRLPAPWGTLIDRDKPVTFTFEGVEYEGFEGDTIASALMGAGRRVLSRSFKYHRPRGPLTMAGQDANTLVQVGPEPNVLADRKKIAPGMKVDALNYFGSLDGDRAMVMDKLGRFLPVGFYYKAFFKPRGIFPFWEKVIRAMAGLGKADLNAHHGYYDKAYGFYDVVVLGGGPAGMAAATEAANAGAEVLLVDENASLGGSLTYARLDADGKKASGLLIDLAAKVKAAANITVLTDATCQSIFTDNWLSIVQGNRLHKVRAKSVVVATGSMEQHIVFKNNDLPGVMMASAAGRLMRLYGVAPGKRVVVAGANADAYGAALDLLDAGVDVAAFVDMNPGGSGDARAAQLKSRNVDVLTGYGLAEAVPSAGKKGVQAVRVARIVAKGTLAPETRTLDCDTILMAPGYAPNAAVLYHAGAKLAYDDATHMFAITHLPPHLFAAGSVNSTYDIEAVLADGRHAGAAAAADAGIAGVAIPDAPADKGAGGITHPWPMFKSKDGRDFIDFDEDLQTKDIENAIADGYQDIQLLKRYSTQGMGPSQGRHSSVPTIRIAARVRNLHPNDIGTTTARPPLGPINMGHLAGRTFEPVRHTAMHHRHLEMGATMMPAGQWMRPAFYGREKERDALIRAEAANVRNNVGLVDVSTLGGLDVRGPDAAEFLNRMYTFAYLKQPVGKSRYLLMTDQSGVITDDGVACRFHDDHFYVTATTSGVQGVYQQMLWWNAQWRLDVDVTNVTASYAGVNIAGPNARKVLEKICEGVDLSAEAFPYMGVREGLVAGIPVRMLRVGFVGELGYELHAPAEQGEALWDALMKAGAEFNIKPFGVEAQRILRLEKGHIIVSQDTDGLTHPYEADMGWAIAKKKPYFIGKKSIEIQNRGGLTRKLVGFAVHDPNAPVPEECHLVIRGGEITGRVTSAAYSPALGHIVGMAYVAPDQAVIGGGFDIKTDHGRMVHATVVPVPFYDPENKRQEM